MFVPLPGYLQKGAWALAGMIGVPVYRGLRFLLADPALRQGRPRAIAVSAAIAAGLAALLFLMPFPCWTRAEGIVVVRPPRNVLPMITSTLGQLPAPPEVAAFEG